jgi:hypothetical protein
MKCNNMVYTKPQQRSNGQRPYVNYASQSKPATFSPVTTFQDSLVTSATQYLGRYGWGTQGKMLGISRMFQDADVNGMKRGKMVASTRPRGVLSGFLAIVPDLQQVIYLPPVAGKIPARMVRMRLSSELLKEGAILSCYWDGGDLVLEDVLVWRGKPVWQQMTFVERWNECMHSFCTMWHPDDVLQGCTVRMVEYVSLHQIVKPGDREVLEFVPNTANTKRMIWLPNEESEEKEYTKHTARRELIIGPDIFSVWSSGEKVERLGIAYIRTLAVSKKLRVHSSDEFQVQTQWNKMFERYEIVDIV